MHPSPKARVTNVDEAGEEVKGAGWIETGNDPIGFPDIELSPDGKPQWVTNYVPHDAVPDDQLDGGNLLTAKE